MLVVWVRARTLPELCAPSPPRRSALRRSTARAERLGPLREFLADADGHRSAPRLARALLSGRPSGQLLSSLVTGAVPLSHAGLDEVGTKAADHLRAVLVTLGVLPERDESLARLERWVAAQVAALKADEHRRLVGTFSACEVLRRRSRAQAPSPSTASPPAASCACASTMSPWRAEPSPIAAEAVAHARVPADS